MVGILSRLRFPLVRIAACLFGLALVSACATAPGPQSSAGNYNGAPVAVALLVPSGSGEATDDLIASGLENAARMAIADLGNVKIDLRVYSTAANPVTAAAMAIKAVDDGAKVILGPFYALEANKAGAAVAGRGVPSYPSRTTRRLRAATSLFWAKRLTIPQSGWRPMPCPRA